MGAIEDRRFSGDCTVDGAFLGKRLAKSLIVEKAKFTGSLIVARDGAEYDDSGSQVLGLEMTCTE